MIPTVRNFLWICKCDFIYDNINIFINKDIIKKRDDFLSIYEKMLKPWVILLCILDLIAENVGISPKKWFHEKIKIPNKVFISRIVYEIKRGTRKRRIHIRVLNNIKRIPILIYIIAYPNCSCGNNIAKLFSILKRIMNRINNKIHFLFLKKKSVLFPIVLHLL